MDKHIGVIKYIFEKKGSETQFVTLGEDVYVLQDG